MARNPIPLPIQIVAAAGIGFAGSLGIAATHSSIPDPRAFFNAVPGFSAAEWLAPGSASANCDIKGNISIETRERIYHVPGQRYYEQTRISPEYGERWFCSEEEARAAGWRKSRS